MASLLRIICRYCHSASHYENFRKEVLVPLWIKGEIQKLKIRFFFFFFYPKHNLMTSEGTSVDNTENDYLYYYCSYMYDVIYSN